MRTSHLVAGGAAAALIAGASIAAIAQDDPPAEEITMPTQYAADLIGGEQVPPVETDARGLALVFYDESTMTLSWRVSYEGLSGPAVAAHIHGPAGTGTNADPIIDFGTELDSPIEGSTIITAEEAADLGAGLWYVNIHTEQNPDGEIRGQLAEAIAELQ
ncbi:MAG: CHRD domain-containing protein [Bauldia sp.]|nr:CHRD domain-containing protein [Bauldia sp.]